MTDRNTEIYDLIGPRRHWTRVAIDIGHIPRAISSKILELAWEKRWQLISTSSFGGNLPWDIEIRGAILGGLPGDDNFRNIMQRDIPAVRIGRWPHPDDARAPAVMQDRPAYGRLAAEHFVSRDFEHVGYIGAKPWQQDRILYEALAERAKELNCHSHLLQIDLDKHNSLKESARNQWERRERLVADWLHSLPLPVGLVFSGDTLADRYCHWVLRAKLRIPEDVAILGIGNDTLTCEPALVPISSIVPDDAGIARKAVQLLDRMMAGQSLDQTTVMVPPIAVVTRQSTDVLAARDPRVITALQLIRRHVTEELSVGWIARQVGVSRRALERAFEVDLGRGIHQEVQRRRLEMARALLRQKDQRIGDIAQALNFSSHQYFCHAFRKVYGMSPAQYRRRHQQAGERSSNLNRLEAASLATPTV